MNIKLEKYNIMETDATTNWIILPVKPLNQAKTRLAEVLTKQQRQNLAFHLFENTMQILSKISSQLANYHILLISADHSLLQEAHKYNVYTLFDTDFAGENDSVRRLNKALHRATQWCTSQFKVASLLVIPSDLPYLQIQDLIQLFELAASIPNSEKIIINPDQSQTGTNAIFLQLASLTDFKFHFGPDSFKKHQEQALVLGVKMQIMQLPGLSFDLDYGRDFQALNTTLQLALTINNQDFRSDP
jgi:2-phospho-L-lactate guanylyltransferase